jgi:hypothetical protein
VWSAVTMREGGPLVLPLAHDRDRNRKQTSNVQRSTSNSQFKTARHPESRRRRGPHVRVVGHIISVVRLRGSGWHRLSTAAITLSSIAIGVGNAPISIVVRVGFGLPSPENIVHKFVVGRKILFHVREEHCDVDHVVPARARVSSTSRTFSNTARHCVSIS